MKRTTKYMLLGGGALLGLLYWQSRRCSADDIRRVAQAAVRGVAGMQGQAAAALLLRELPRQQPRMWAACRPALMRELVNAGLSPATLSSLSAASWGAAVDAMLDAPVTGERTLAL